MLSRSVLNTGLYIVRDAFSSCFKVHVSVCDSTLPEIRALGNRTAKKNLRHSSYLAYAGAMKNPHKTCSTQSYVNHTPL
jgi:hypothetical protein